jgi:hypothetical protein
MRSVAGILGVVLAGAIVYYLYSVQFSRVEGGLPQAQQIDLVGIRSDLISFAQSERIFLATNGVYGTLEQLQRSGNVNPTPLRRRGYVYEAELDGARHFRIVARPADPSGPVRPTLSIDETMQISSGAESSQSQP